MATQRWVGSSANVRSIKKITVANTWTAADTYTLTVDNVDFVITIGTLVTTAQVATTIFQALSGTTFTDTTASCTVSIADGGGKSIPQFSEFDATNGTASEVLLTGNGTGPLAGKPFTIAVTGDGTASTGTGAITSIVTPTSQYHADQADNYSGNAVLSGGDTFVFDSGSTDMRYALDLGVTLAVLTKYKTYTGNVGLAEFNNDNTSKVYHEYRTPTYLTCTAATLANLEVGEGPGSGRFKLDTGTGQSAINIFGKGQRVDTGIPCILWKGTHASNAVSNLAGDLGVAFFGGEVATIATLVVGDGPTSAAQTLCGSGTTLTTVKLVGGSLITRSAVTTGSQYAGAWDHYSGTVTTLTVYGGTFTPHAACTITTGTVYGKIDLSKTAGTITFTNVVNLYGNAEIYDPNGKATFSAGYKLNSVTAKVTRPAGDTHSLT